MHFRAHYTLFLLLFFAWKVFHLWLYFLFSLGLLRLQSTKLWTYYQLSLNFLLLSDLQFTYFTFLFLLVTVVYTDHLRLHQILDQKRLSLVKAMLPNELLKLVPIVLRSQQQCVSFILSDLYLYFYAFFLHFPFFDLHK